MGTEEAAITMVNYYTTVTPHIRNVPVFIQYSNHKELKTDAGNQVGAQLRLFQLFIFCFKCYISAFLLCC